MKSSSPPTLVVGQLTIESSRADESERPASIVGDTVQFWITPARRWKTRTFAADHDLLCYDLGDLGTARDRPVEFAVEHIAKHYGDILRSTTVVRLTDVDEPEGAGHVLAAHGLRGALQRCDAGDAGIWIWSPDGADYRTKQSD
jgi:hypothetical protein